VNDTNIVTNDRKLKIGEVALLIGSSIYTINLWYKFKREEPDNEYAKLLPDYYQDGERQTRYWLESDIWKLIEFKQSINVGRKGFMGAVTQRYDKKSKRYVKKEA